MKVASFAAIVGALNGAEVRFIVVGGVAVNAHGYLRFTKNVDLVIQLSERDIVASFRALEEIGYFPSNPITAKEFADPVLRESWRKEKGMLVLKMWSDRHRETPLDIFVYEPFDFDAEYERTAPKEGEMQARFASIQTLIEMKLVADRTQDRLDIEKLTIIEEIKRDASQRNETTGN